MLTYSLEVSFCEGNKLIEECKNERTHVKEFGIVENLAFFEVVPLRVAEALF